MDSKKIFVIILKNATKDVFVRTSIIVIVLLSVFMSFVLGCKVGFLILISFATGCAVAVALIVKKENIKKFVLKLKQIYQQSQPKLDGTKNSCDICKAKDCKRHITQQKTQREPWSEIYIDSNLDAAIESFYSKIIGSFIQSWFVLVSSDSDFVKTLKQGLRQATANLIDKVSKLDAPLFITQKLLPILFQHTEVITQMLEDGTTLDKLPNQFVLKDQNIHPAVCSRQSEKDYLRAVAKCLIPKIFHSENFDSKIFFSLIREILACWVLLPLMDVLCDPNLLNLMVINIISKGQNEKLKVRGPGTKVEFLKHFVEDSEANIILKDPSILTNSDKLYAFMQYLKKIEVVDALRFYLDVENLNKELQDAKTISDPAKLSALYQESEKLMKDYRSLVTTDKLAELTEAKTLSEAHENIKNLLEGEWRKSFSKTPEYFKLIYGSRQIDFAEDSRNMDQNWGVARLRSKIKGAFKGTVDGTSFEATEIPTVWDALAEPNLPSSSTVINSNSTQKLKRERGQNLDSFLLVFLQSLEQSTDVGEDVIKVNEKKLIGKSHYSTGFNPVFGNLFCLNKASKNFQMSSYISFETIGPSRSLLYIVNNLLRTSKIIVKFIYSMIKLSQDAIDFLIYHGINKLISLGLYQPRLGALIRLLEEHIFEDERVDVTPEELLERQRKARKMLENLLNGSGYLLDMLQSPPLNKHLMYCAFDSLLSELYPEFKG
ncbi:sorting nexin-14-like [Condylostylus longicornis]|uniref:sorting nexin-14-like n=1 Tax=Condylostylus longicornis TaxID=2530218 RepID=UPI00244DA1F1|nr:sorting nexin-14-like [Condylostylus longicornis]